MRNQTGFTLIEILVALAVFAIVVVGALGLIGATNAAGVTEGISTGLVTGRTSKDITAASTYLRGFQEYMAATVDASTVPGTTNYSASSPPADVMGYTVLPSAQPYQLEWSAMSVTIDTWNWDCASSAYVSGGAATGDQLIRVEATLTWTLKGAARSITVERFVPYRPGIPFPGSVCT